jgi:ribosomal protein S1
MLTVGQVVQVEVRSVAAFGVFCQHAEQEVLVLIPETSWAASFCSCEQFAASGDRFTVKVLHADPALSKVKASIGLFGDMASHE